MVDFACMGQAGTNVNQLLYACEVMIISGGYAPTLIFEIESIFPTMHVFVGCKGVALRQYPLGLLLTSSAFIIYGHLHSILKSDFSFNAVIRMVSCARHPKFRTKISHKTLKNVVTTVTPASTATES